MDTNLTSIAPSSAALRPLIVIPVYNNRPTLHTVTLQALQTGLDVLVVNDGSDDGGPATLDGLAMSRVDLPENQGKGAAIQAGVRWAGERGYTHIITIDADGQHDPQDALSFVEKLREDPSRIIIGRRDLRAAGAPFASVFGRQFSNFWLKIASGALLPDSQSGFRAYPVEVLQGIPCGARRYDFEVEVLVRAAWAGIAFLSVDIGVRYFPPSENVSHYRPIRDNFLIAVTYTKLVARNLIPWPHKAQFRSARL